MSIGISIAAAVAAIASAAFVWLQVREMQRQTTLQRQVAEASSQPYVWADVRIQDSNDWLIELAIGNSGPTVATNVRVLIDPPIPGVDDDRTFAAIAQEKLAAGLSSLAPGRSLHWTLGPSPDLVNRVSDTSHRVTIDCDGPFGRVERAEYIVDFADFRESVVRQIGTLSNVARAVDELAKRLPDPRRPIQVQVRSEE